MLAQKNNHIIKAVLCNIPRFKKEHFQNTIYFSFFFLVTDVHDCSSSSFYRKYNWVYPRLHPVHELDPSIHKKDSSDISIDKVISYLRATLEDIKHREDSAVVLNYGLHLARSTSFEKYKQLISNIRAILKKYEGEVIWRTTTSVWQQTGKVHKRFQTYQVTHYKETNN